MLVFLQSIALLTLPGVASGFVTAAAAIGCVLSASMIAYLPIAVMTAHHHPGFDAVQMSGLRWRRAGLDSRGASPTAPTVVIPIVTGTLVLAFSALYYALHLADPSALHTSSSFDAFDAVYYSAVTATTLGDGDIWPTSHAAQFGVVGQIGLSVTALSVFVWSLTRSMEPPAVRQDRVELMQMLVDLHASGHMPDEQFESEKQRIMAR